MTNSKNNNYVEQILEKIKSAYHLDTDASLARFLDMKPNTLAMQKKRGSLNWVRIFEKCSDLDKNWLLHSNHDSSNDFPVLIPMVKQNNIKTGTSVLSDTTSYKKVTFPVYLLPEDLIDYTDQLILVNVDQPPPSSRLTDGDVVLTHVNVSQPVENKFYLVTYKQKILLTRINIRSEEKVLLFDQQTSAPMTYVNRNTSDFSIIGRVYWVGSKFK